MKKLSLKTKINLIIIISLGPILVVSLLSMLIFYLRLQANIERQITTQGHSVINTIEQYRKQSYIYSKMIANMPAVQRGVQFLAKEEEMEKYLAPLIDNFGVDSVTIHKKSGTNIIIKAAPHNFSLVNQVDNDNILVKNALLEGIESGDIVLTQDNTGKYVELKSTVPVFGYTNKIRIFGSCSVGYKLTDKFAKKIKKLSGTNIIVANKQKIIASSFDKKIIENPNNIFNFNEKVQQVNIDGKNLDTRVIPVKFSSENRLENLAFWVVTDNTDIRSTIKWTLWGIILFSILIIIIALTISVTIGANILKAMGSLLRGTEFIAKKDFSHQIKVTTGDELEKLADTFNDMTKQLKISYQELETANKTLVKINQINRKLSSILDRNELINFGLTQATQLINARRGSVMLLDSENNLVVCAAVGWDYKKTKLNKFKLGSVGIASQVCSKSEAIIINDINTNSLFEKFSQKIWEGSNSLLCVPLKEEENIIGVININDKFNSLDFNHNDTEILKSIASQMVLSFDNIEKMRLKSEMATAKAVQNTLLPQKLPSAEAVDVTGFFTPASECGGDWWGYFEREDNLYLLVGDVTGHGVSSALITATARACCETINLLQKDLPAELLNPASILQIMNKIIYSTAQEQFYMTVFASSINKKTREIIFSNAGHNCPFIYRTDLEKKNNRGRFHQISSLASRGPRLGFQKNNVYENQKSQLDSGDIILWYTDGLIECRNPEDQEYGKNNLLQSMIEKTDDSSQEIVKNIVDKAFNFYGDKEIEDDITVVVGKIK